METGDQTISGQVAAENLRRLRLKHDVTQEELGKKAGLSRATVAQIEGCRYKTLRLATLERLAKALGCTVAALLEPPKQKPAVA